MSPGETQAVARLSTVIRAALTTERHSEGRGVVLVSGGDGEVVALPGGWLLVASDDEAAAARAVREAGLDTVIFLAPGQVQGGELLVVEDHINLTGANPLTGPNVDAWGVRFPDMTEPYDRGLRETLGRFGQAGIVAGVPAPIRPGDLGDALSLGAHAVSTGIIHGAIAARHCGLRVGAMVVPDDRDLPALARRIVAEA